MQTHLCNRLKDSHMAATEGRGWWSHAAHRNGLRSVARVNSQPDGSHPDKEPIPSPTDVGVRTELVERVRREIAAGSYDTPEKWSAALDRLCSRLEEA